MPRAEDQSELESKGGREIGAETKANLRAEEGTRSMMRVEKGNIYAGI